MDIKSILDQHRKQKTTDMPVIKEMAQFLLSDALKSVIQEFNDKIEQMTEDFDGEIVKLEGDFKEEVQKIQNDLDKKGDKGDKGEDGKSGIDGRNGFDGKDGKNGKDGNDGIGRDGLNGKNGIDGKDGSPDNPLQTADKLNTLEEKVEIKVIRGLTDRLKNLQNSIRERSGGRLGGGGVSVCSGWITPTGVLNGINKTFTVPGHFNLLSAEVQINGQGYYDFTVSGSTYTLTDAPASTDLLKVRHWL